MSIDKQQQDIWFPAKRYGWGWGLPVRWQGWLVLALYLLLMVTGISWFASAQPVFRSLYMLALTIALMLICWRKGERPRWRWGE